MNNKILSLIKLNDKEGIVQIFIFYCCGLVFGSNFMRYIISESLNKLFITNSEQNFIRLFLIAIITNTLIFLLITFAGISISGVFINSVIVALIGSFNGISISDYIMAYGNKGIAYSILMIVPFSSLFLTIFFIQIANSNSFSKQINSAIINKNSEEISSRTYFIKSIILAVILLISSLISTYLISLLSNIVTI